jgi:hypothetical protein
MILLVQHLRSNYDWRSVIRKKKNVREIHVVSLDIVGNVVLPLRLTAELDVRVCKAFAGTPVFSLFLPLFHSHIYREREQLQLMQISQTDVLDVHFLLSFDLFGNSQSGTTYWSAVICHIDSPDLAISVCADFSVEEAHACASFARAIFIWCVPLLNT